MSQIKKVEKLYNQKYYLEHKVEKGIKSRIEVNKINGAKRHQDSKTLVLKYALDLVAQNEKITIKTIKNILELNNEKLGTTQISIYLRELKNEGLISESEQKMMQKEQKEFDQMYQKLLQDLKANPDDERVINAMLEFYESRMNITTLIINKLKEAKQQKNTHNESSISL